MSRRLTTRGTTEITIDVINAVLGLCLALAPWVLGFAGEAVAARNAWITGAVIALVAVGALISFTPWEEWVNLILGFWAAIAPWALGFAGGTNATYAHVVVGVAVAVLAAAELWIGKNRPLSTA